MKVFLMGVRLRFSLGEGRLTSLEDLFAGSAAADDLRSRKTKTSMKKKKKVRVMKKKKKMKRKMKKKMMMKKMKMMKMRRATKKVLLVLSESSLCLFRFLVLLPLLLSPLNQAEWWDWDR